MPKLSLSELEKNYESSQHQLKLIERKLQETKNTIDELHKSFESDLKDLKQCQEDNRKLKELIFEAQKDKFKEILNLDGVKKVLNNANPLLSKIKNGVKNKTTIVKEYIHTKNTKNIKLEIFKEWLNTNNVNINNRYKSSIKEIYENYINYVLNTKEMNESFKDYIYDNENFILNLKNTFSEFKCNEKLKSCNLSYNK